MNHKLWAIFHILIQPKYGTWALDRLKGHLVPKEFQESCNNNLKARPEAMEAT